jgi:hypothetical protein
MKIFLPLCFMMLLGTAVSGQSMFKNLTVVQYGDSIRINWTLIAGNTCFDMHLMRSQNGSDFGEVFSVPGVCGGSEDQYYDFVDNNNLVSATTYEYMVTASNGLFASEVTGILYINAGDVSLFLFPNPTQSDIQVTVDNKFTPEFIVELYQADGKLIQTTRETSNLFTINTSLLAPSGYLIKILTEDGDVIAQQFIVQ